MKTDSEPSSRAPSPGQSWRRRILRRPSTRIGWWSVALAATFLVLFIINSTVFMPSTVAAPWRQTVLPFYGIAMLLCGLSAAIVDLIAVLRQNERSWLIWLAMLPGLMVLAFILGESLVPH